LSALDEFSELEALQKQAESLAHAIEQAYAAAGPHGCTTGVIGGTHGFNDRLRHVDHIIDAKVVEDLQQVVARLQRHRDRVRWICYGRSGRGGLAKAKSRMDADILYCRYVQGMRWTEIAKEVTRPNVVRPNTWCRTRAMRALGYVDRVGIETLIDS
jgi:hypothetical protein